MRRLLLLLAVFPALAAITGTVNNQTTGQPAAGVTVTLYKFGAGGMEPVDKTKTDAAGKFSIDQAPAAQGPSMLRVEQDGVTYNHMMPPGSPSADIGITIYNATAKPGSTTVSKHMLMFEPSGGQLAVSETFLYQNTGKTTWSDPKNGTLRFFLPKEAQSNVEVKGTAPDGMAVPVPTDKSSQPDIFIAKFEIKPGETRFDLTYTVPYTEGATYAGKIATEDDNTYLIAPAGVTLEGGKLKDLGQEPRTQAHVFGLDGKAFSVKLTGSAAPAAADDSASADSTGSQIEEIAPRVYTKVWPILGLAFGILALGFALLYRKGSKETHERGRS